MRALEAERLERAAACLMPQVEAGNLRAHEVWLRNRARYAALLGLNLKPEADGPAALTVVLTGSARLEDAPREPSWSMPGSRGSAKRATPTRRWQ